MKRALNKIFIVRIYTNKILKIEGWDGRDGVGLGVKILFYLIKKLMF